MPIKGSRIKEHSCGRIFKHGQKAQKENSLCVQQRQWGMHGRLFEHFVLEESSDPVFVDGQSGCICIESRDISVRVGDGSMVNVCVEV